MSTCTTANDGICKSSIDLRPLRRFWSRLGNVPFSIESLLVADALKGSIPGCEVAL